MFAAALTLALFATSAIAAPLRSVPRAYQPADYRDDILEPYFDYHSRYTALSCQTNHGKQFFDDCCHPLMKGQTLSSRPAQCTPSAPASSSAVIVESTISEIECSEEETSTSAPTSTSAVVATTTPVVTTSAAPQTTTSAAPAKTTTKATTKTTSSAQPTQTSGGGAPNTGGVATFFYQGGQAGACGDVHSDSDLIVAIDERRYGDSSRRSALCGRKVSITNTKNGKNVIATIADDCPTCKNSNSIDLSSGTFEKIATFDEGEVPITWTFV